MTPSSETKVEFRQALSTTKRIIGLLLSLTASCATAQLMELHIVGTVDSVSGTYLSTRASVGDPFTLDGTFDAAVHPVQSLQDEYDYNFRSTLTFKVRGITWTMPSFVGASLDARVLSNLSSIDGYYIQAVTPQTADLNQLELTVLLYSTNLSLTSNPPTHWLQTTSVSTFNNQRFLRIQGSDLINNYPNYLVSISGPITSVTVTESPLSPPYMTRQPDAATVTAGGTVSFISAAGGGGTLSYQWRKDGATLVGATSSTLSISNVLADQAGDYTVVVSNSYGSVTSQAAKLTVNTPAPTSQAPAPVPVAPSTPAPAPTAPSPPASEPATPSTPSTPSAPSTPSTPSAPSTPITPTAPTSAASSGGGGGGGATSLPFLLALSLLALARAGRTRKGSCGGW